MTTVTGFLRSPQLPFIQQTLPLKNSDGSFQMNSSSIGDQQQSYFSAGLSTSDSSKDRLSSFTAATSTCPYTPWNNPQSANTAFGTNNSGTFPPSSPHLPTGPYSGQQQASSYSLPMHSLGSNNADLAACDPQQQSAYNYHMYNYRLQQQHLLQQQSPNNSTSTYSPYQSSATPNLTHLSHNLNNSAPSFHSPISVNCSSNNMGSSSANLGPFSLPPNNSNLNSPQQQQQQPFSFDLSKSLTSPGYPFVANNQSFSNLTFNPSSGHVHNYPSPQLAHLQVSPHGKASLPSPDGRRMTGPSSFMHQQQQQSPINLKRELDTLGQPTGGPRLPPLDNKTLSSTRGKAKGTKKTPCNVSPITFPSTMNPMLTPPKGSGMLFPTTEGSTNSSSDLLSAGGMSLTDGDTWLDDATGERTSEQNKNGSKKSLPRLGSGRRDLKHDPNASPESIMRREDRRKRNRESAQRCRARKNSALDELGRQKDELNTELKSWLTKLMSALQTCRTLHETVTQNGSLCQAFHRSFQSSNNTHSSCKSSSSTASSPHFFEGSCGGEQNPQQQQQPQNQNPVLFYEEICRKVSHFMQEFLGDSTYPSTREVMALSMADLEKMISMPSMKSSPASMAPVKIEPTVSCAFSTGSNSVEGGNNRVSAGFRSECLASLLH